MIKNKRSKLCQIMLIILSCAILICLPCIKVQAISTDAVTQTLNSLIKQYEGKKWTQSFAGGKECYAFAHYVFDTVFGRGNRQVGNGASTQNSTCYKLNNIASDITTIGILSPGYSLSDLESLLEKAAPGDYVQVKRNNTGSPHSMIVAGINPLNNSIDIFDANSDGKGTIKHYTQSFSYFQQRNAGVSVYRYSEYSPSSNNKIELVKSPSDTILTKESDITFSWTTGSTHATGYNLYVAPLIEGTVNYDWSNARNYIPGYASTSYTYSAGTLKEGAYAAYVEGWNAETGWKSESSNFVYFVIENNYVLEPVKLTLEPDSINITKNKDVTFSWNKSGKNALGYNLYVAPYDEKTGDYNWKEARNYVPGYASTSYTYSAGTLKEGAYAAYVEAWNEQDNVKSEKSNFVYFVITKEDYVLEPPTLSLESKSNVFDEMLDITFNWTISGTKALGYNLYVAPYDEKTGAYNWKNARNYVPGYASTSYTYTAGTLKDGVYAAYVEAWNEQDDIRSKESNLVYFSITGKTAVTGVSLDKSSLCFSEKGEAQRLRAVITPANATNQAVVFESSDTSVVTVDKEGLVKAVSNGTALIKVKTTDGGYVAVCDVEVNIPVDVAGVVLDQTEIKFKNIGETRQITAQVIPANADNQKIFYQSSDESVAIVDNIGMVTAVNSGSASIIAITEDGKYTAECNVIVDVPESEICVTLDRSEIFFGELGERVKLMAAVTPQKYEGTMIIWESSNPNIVDVDDTGTVTALANGVTNITAKIADGGNIAVCHVNVSAQVAVEKIILCEKNITFTAIGEAKKISAVVYPENATNKNIIWESSDEKIVEVDEKGLVKAIGDGSAFVFARSEDGSVMDICSVAVKAPIEVTGVELDKNMIMFERSGEKENLVVSVLPANADNQNVNWVSSDENVVTVDENGVVTAVGEGTAQVLVVTQEGNKWAYCMVTVKNTGNHNHIFRVASITDATCLKEGVIWYQCSCGETKLENIPVNSLKHNYKIISGKEATVFAEGTKIKKCSECGKEETISVPRLVPTIKLNTSNITLKVKQKTSKVKVSGLAKGDKVRTWKSSNKKIVKVTSAGKIIAQNRKGRATLTVVLQSGKTATINVKVQKGKVKTTKISGLPKKIIMEVGEKLKLKPEIVPITSIQKITYSTSDKKIAYVNSKRCVIAKKTGKVKITVKSGTKKFVITVIIK